MAMVDKDEVRHVVRKAESACSKSADYHEVADWLDEVAAEMKMEAEKSVFSARPARPVLTMQDVRGLAKDLRERAKAGD